MTGSVAILCSGQGGQHREMFALTGAVPEAEPVFAAAAPHLGGVDPRAFVRDAPEEALFSNRAGQILCCTQALAAWAMLGDARPDRAVLAGYSVGELAAWGLAGLLPPTDLLALAASRADAMDRAAPPGTGLASASGLPRAALERVLPDGVTVAISNADDAFIVGGTDAGLSALAGHPGLRTSRLRVAVPSHTALLGDAAVRFAEVLAARSWERPSPGSVLLSGIDAEPVRDPAAGATKLAVAIAAEIRWADCLRACSERGATVVLELGPGSALARMAEQLSLAPAIRALDQFRTPGGVREWLDRRADAG
ncbi:MAG: acyltransferase domain-containing protein [Gluconacetobacter diazotrophicus]|nr:acyltransferase domain-containing protein [Gluconacetobacter diazotrophicus]